MKITNKKIEELIPYARNSRTHSAEQVAQIAASMREFGWTNPPLIRPDNTIIAGHGRLLAAKEAGIKTVPCIVLENLTDAQARALVIADNKIALNGGWDIDTLAKELNDLKELDFDLDVIGFSDEELNHLIDSVDGESDGEADGESNGETDGKGTDSKSRAAVEADSIETASKSLLSMKVGKTIIPITAEEHDAFIERLDEYVERVGAPYGFIAELLGGA